MVENWYRNTRVNSGETSWVTRLRLKKFDAFDLYHVLHHEYFVFQFVIVVDSNKTTVFHGRRRSLISNLMHKIDPFSEYLKSLAKCPRFLHRLHINSLAGTISDAPAKFGSQKSSTYCCSCYCVWMYRKSSRTTKNTIIFFRTESRTSAVAWLEWSLSVSFYVAINFKKVRRYWPSSRISTVTSAYCRDFHKPGLVDAEPKHREVGRWTNLWWRPALGPEASGITPPER